MIFSCVGTYTIENVKLDFFQHRGKVDFKTS